MKSSRSDIMQRLSEIEEGLDLEDPVMVGTALRGLIECAGKAFAAPERVVVGFEHLEAAAQIITGYLENDDDHRLLAFVLAGLDERMSAEAEYRLGVVGALAQLACDGLCASVLQLTEWEDLDNIDERDARAAARELFARIMLVRQRDERTES